ncbi:extensin-2-like isoform X2 [Pieris napi]|uniref:extensin-2-like isoform X2 n=1 Tax=Pieris napi TaxID=78633 RepID=UPI001FBB2C44|nr:extensin-2-like isoform X2 [Pieris napi]
MPSGYASDHDNCLWDWITRCIGSYGAAEKETDEEEGSAGAAPPDDAEQETESGKHILSLTSHPPPVEASASMQDFFKMLDEKIEKGKDYDSSSETEVRIENERRKRLIDEWRSASQSSQSQASPPTPARRRIHRPMPPQPPERHSPGTARRCYRQQHVPEGMSPPPRRTQSAQSQHPHETRHNGDNWQDPTKSPVKRPQSAGANWKSNPKVTPYQKPKKNEVNENQRAVQKDLDSQSDTSQESQVTYNPTFQTHSPAHSTKQPYIAQIISYPTSQQVTPPSTPKYIAPPEEYQDPQNNTVDNKYSQPQTPVTQVNTQSNIYYIHGNATTPSPDLAHQRQQTAFHLQQYVAMKQAQQQMFTYLQRGPHTVFPNVDYSQIPHPRVYEGEEFTPQYAHGHPTLRPHSAPTPVGVVRPMAVAPGFAPLPDGTHMVQMPMYMHMPPVVSTMGPWMHGQTPEMQYYPQTPFMPMYRPNSAGSAGTLTRYQKKETIETDGKNMCQSINLVRQKQVGQIVSLPGQELTVCNNPSDSPSSASVSTDSGVSPGNSAPSSKCPTFTDSFTNAIDNKKKVKSAPFASRPLKNSKSLDS